MPVSVSPGSLQASVAGLKDSLKRERAAWASWRDYAEKAHLAAVMGRALPRHCRESSDWTLDDSLKSDDHLQEEIWQAAGAGPAADQLANAIREHVR